MKLAVFCISGLCTQVLGRLRLAALDDIAYHDVASTIPIAPITSWTSAWTGVDPAVHGKFTGARGKTPKLETVWDRVKQAGYDVALHKEGDWDGIKADVHVYRLDSMANLLLAEDLSGAQESLNGLAKIISEVQNLGVPYIILSAFGVNQYVMSLNVDRLLMARNLMQMSERNGVLYEKTYAYPADYTGRKPRMTYGIFVNTIDSESGFVEMHEATAIEGDLLAQLNQVDDIEARSAHQVYDIGGAYYPELPAIVFRSYGRTCFRSTGNTAMNILTPYNHYNLSPTGMIAASDERLIQGVNSVTDFGTSILRAIRGGQDE